MKLVIFDMDGLMFDTEAVTARAYIETGKEQGFDASLDMYKELIGLDARATWEKYREFYGIDIDAPKLYKTVGLRLDKILEEEGVPTKPGLYEILDAIDAAGLKKVIASGSSRKQINEHLERSGLAGRFDGIISSDEVKTGKPAPDVFLACLDMMNIKAEDAVILEDSPYGIQAAKNAGISVIAVPDLLEIPEELQKQCLGVYERLDDIDVGSLL